MVALFLVSPLVACGYWSPEELALKPRLEARWRSADASIKALGDRARPLQWSGGAFLGATALNDILDQFEGYRFEYVRDSDWLNGTVIRVESVDLEPHFGYAEATVRLSAVRNDVRLNMAMAANISFEGFSQSESGKGSIEARLRVEPLSVSPELRWGMLGFAANDFWARLGPDLAVALADPNLFQFKIPLKDTAALRLGLNRDVTEIVNKDTGATVTYNIALPESTFEERLSFGPPVFRPEGIWLLARSSEQGQEFSAPSIPPSLPEDLASEVAKLQTELETATEAFKSTPETVAIIVGKDLFERIGARIAALPDDRRRIAVQSKTRAGQLARGDWRDDLLGGGGYYAELAGGDRASLSLQIGRPTVGWDKGALSLTVPVQANVKADVHIHFDPLIGGGAGTTIGLEGAGGGTIRVQTVPKVIAAQDISIAVLDTALSCDLIEASVATDGRLAVDMGWITVPRVGARFRIPVGRNQIGTTPLFDSRPTFVELPMSDPRLESDAVKRQAMLAEDPWAKIPSAGAFKLSVVPTKISGNDDGYYLEATLKIETVQFDSGSSAQEHRAKAVAEWAALQERVNAFLSEQRPPEACAAETEMAVLLGQAEIGPNNEVVKFARNAWSDLTKGPGPNNELRRMVSESERVLKQAGKDLENGAKAVVKGVEHLIVEVKRWNPF